MGKACFLVAKAERVAQCVRVRACLQSGRATGMIKNDCPAVVMGQHMIRPARVMLQFQILHQGLNHLYRIFLNLHLKYVLPGAASLKGEITFNFFNQ